MKVWVRIRVQPSSHQCNVVLGICTSLLSPEGLCFSVRRGPVPKGADLLDLLAEGSGDSHSLKVRARLGT